MSATGLQCLLQCYSGYRATVVWLQCLLQCLVQNLFMRRARAVPSAACAHRAPARLRLCLGMQVGGTLVAGAQPIPDPEFISPAPAQEAAPVAAAAAMEAGPGLPVSQLAPAAEAPAVVAAAPVMLTPQPVVAPMPVAPQPMAPQPMAPQPMAPQPMAPQPMPAPMLVPAPVPMAAPAPVPQAGSSPPSTPLGSATPVQQGSPPTTPTSSTRMPPIIQKPNQLPNMPVMAPGATTPQPFTPQPMPQSAAAVQQQPAIVPFQPEPATP